MSNKWWGRQFFAALESFIDPNRLSRGRSYYSSGRIIHCSIQKGEIKAKVRGKVNHYFGIYKAPTYNINIKFKSASQTEWADIVDGIAQELRLITEFMIGEIPTDIEQAFSNSSINFLPRSRNDFCETKCSCPDWDNPCKHIAAVYYEIADRLDQDPFLLFELRGLAPDQLHQQLADTPVGKALASYQQEHKVTATSDYSSIKPVPVEKTVNWRHFWVGQQLPSAGAAEEVHMAAPLIKKGGDYPAFWHRESSFISFMEQIYEKINRTHRL